MKRNKFSLLLIILALSVPITKAQTPASLSLQECVKLAKENYPLIKEKQLLQQTEALNIKSLNKNWLPKLSLNAQATYQSEVSSLPIPGFPEFPKDQYQNALSVDQTLFDGGNTQQQKEVEKLNTETETQKNEVELYKVADRVTQIYCNILLARENRKILFTYKEDIGNKKKTLNASVQNGLALESNLSTLEAEELKTEQNMIELEGNLTGLYSSLALLINKPVDDNIDFTTQTLTASAEVSRPELKLFSAQSSLLEARYKLSNKGALPKLSLFGEGVYGRPGYNFLDQSFRFYGRVGLALRWNISSLYYLNKEKQSLDVNISRVDVQKQLFELNLKSTLSTQDAQIKSLQEIIDKDNQIIEKRVKVTQTAAKQLENGNITSTDYLTELNAEMQARLNMKVHEVKLMNAISNQATTKGLNQF